ncbi:MAG: EAL domain-containing protein [Butyrivibrio sp.]|nr:EAL domain-containing protein [Butyrivibrio sp.]
MMGESGSFWEQKQDRKEFLQKTSDLVGGSDADYSMLSLNLDNYSALECVFGRQIIGKLVCAVSTAISGYIGGNGFWTSIGNERFYACLLSEKVLPEKLSGLISINMMMLKVRSFLCYHMGYARIENHCESVFLAMNQADEARKQVQNHFSANAGYFNTAMTENMILEQQLLADIKEALVKKNFTAFFQPIYDTQKRLCAMEALGRWKKNDTVVMPDTFVPIMEKYGMIQKLDFQILEKALFFLQTALQKNKKAVPVSVNISRYYLSDRSLADQICQTVDRFGISHHLIKLEITETAAGNDSQNISKLLMQLKKMEFAVILDDCGSGYATPEAIMDAQYDMVKIDRAFAQNMVSDRHSNILLRHMLAAFHEMGIPTIVEGVENAAVCEQLCAMECQYMQGFYFSRPLVQSDAEQLLI